MEMAGTAHVLVMEATQNTGWAAHYPCSAVTVSDQWRGGVEGKESDTGSLATAEGGPTDVELRQAGRESGGARNGARAKLGR